MRSKAPLTLMEQMVMLLVFALAAALCLQAFVKSDQLSKRGEERDRAVILCQSAAEAIQYHSGQENTALEDVTGISPYPYSGSIGVSSYFGVAVGLDENWNPVEWELDDKGWVIHKNEVYTLLVKHLPYENGLMLGKTAVKVLKGEETLFELTVAWQEVSGNG